MATAKRKKKRAAAILTINNPRLLSPRGRRAIAKWLEKQALNLMKYHKTMADARYTARYLY